MGLPWDFHETSIGCHRIVVLAHGAPMGLPWFCSVIISLSCHSHGTPKAGPWVSHGSPMRLLRVSHGILMESWCWAMELPWVFHRFAISPWVYHAIPTVFYWILMLVNGASMVIPWVLHGTPMRLATLVHGSPVGFPWFSHGVFHGSHMGLSWVHWSPMSLPWVSHVFLTGLP